MIRMRNFVAVLAVFSFVAVPSFADNLGSATGGDAATQSGIGGCIYNSSAPTINNGQQVAVQCDANGNQKINIAGGSITPSGTQDTNLKQVNGTTVNVGTGASSTGTQRVTTSTDSTIGTVTTVTNPVTVAQPTGTNLHAVLDTTSTTAVTQATAANLNATVVGTGTFTTQSTLQTGANIVGKVGIDQTTDVTTNGVEIAPTTGSAAAITSVQSTAVETAHVIKAGAGNLYGFQTVSGAVAGYVLLLNLTSDPGNGAVAPMKCYPLPANSILGASWASGPPLRFSTGLTIVFSTTGCFTETQSATAFISGDAK